MPKFNIYEPLGGMPAEDTNTRRVSIGWARGQHAQIGVGRVDQNETVPEQVSWSGDFMIEVEKDEAGKRWRTEWVNLDRPTINHLIRELRKARDEAFGRDE